MLAKIARGYGKLFGTVGRILALLVLCGIIGCAVVFPLWKFATSAPSAYTATVLTLLLASLLYVIIKKCCSVGKKRALKALLLFCIIAAGLTAAVVFVLNANRLFAVISLCICIILYGICSFGINSHDTKR